MSGGFPEEKPCASCCPRSEATTTFTLLPVFFAQAAVATLTAFVSAGPELPIRAVIVTAFLLAGEPSAVPAVTASADTAAARSALQHAIRNLRLTFTNIPSLTHT